MSRPSDVHYDRIDERVFELARRTLEAVQTVDAEAVLGGGWAVYAHTAHVPSVDVDLYLPPGEQEELTEALAEADLEIGRGGEVELLGLDTEIEVWGFGDPDLGVARPAYTPREVFEGRLDWRRLDLREKTVSATVPSRPALAITKLVALRNRDLAYRSWEDGQARMALGPALANRIRGRARSYYRRKAGKDLLDLGVLLEDESGDEFVDLLGNLDLLAESNQVLTDLDAETVRLARDLADRADAGDPLESAGRWLES